MGGLRNHLFSALLLLAGAMPIASQDNSPDIIHPETSVESLDATVLTIEDAFLQGLLDDSVYEAFDQYVLERKAEERKQFEQSIRDASIAEDKPFGEILLYKDHGYISQTERYGRLFSADSGWSYEDAVAMLQPELRSNWKYLTFIGHGIYYATTLIPFDDPASIRNYNQFVSRYSVENGGSLESLEIAYNAYVNIFDLSTLPSENIVFGDAANPASVYTSGTDDSFKALVGFIDFLDTAGYDVELVRLIRDEDYNSQDAWLRVYINDVGFDIDPLRDRTFTLRQYNLEETSGSLYDSLSLAKNTSSDEDSF